MTFLGLRVNVRGKAKCWFYDSGKHYSRRTTETHGEEIYLNSMCYLFGSEYGESHTLESGIHTFSFECQLPSEIPYSVDGKFASIRYKVVADLKLLNDKNYQEENIFTVRRCDDLSLVPHLRFPVEAEKNKELLRFCRFSGFFKMKVTLPRTGFALGEAIIVAIELINESNTQITHTKVSLKKLERFVGTAGAIWNIISTESKIHSPGVDGRKRNFSNVKIKVPQDLRTSNDKYCRIYQITYELKITAVWKRLINLNPMKGPHIRIPIVIGTV